MTIELTTEDAQYLTNLGRRLEEAQGLPTANGPTCTARHWGGAHCCLPSGHAELHEGSGYVWGSAAHTVRKPCPGCAEPCGQCDHEGLD